jgi:peroxiredoxin
MLRFISSLAACAFLASTATAELSGQAPNFSLKSRSGDTVALADLKGDVVMINFWATWCGPCRKEMPHLDALHRRYKDLGFTLLGLNVEDNEKGALKFLQETPVSFEILFDPANRVSALYDVVAMPTTIMVDRNGNVRHVHHGYQAGYENEYQTQIRALLRE